jgi:uncharacterized protein YdhG (YjbR/CyaY superfamily)
VKPGTAASVDAYIAAAPEAARPMLEQLRSIISSAVPEAEEHISYQMPMYKHHGLLVGFAAARNHVGFYGASGTLLDPFRDELKAYKTGKGTVQFPIGSRIPVALVKKLVKAKAKENERSAERKRATVTRPSRRRP